MLNIWYKYRKNLCPFHSPRGPVTEIENFPANMKMYVELFKGKKVIRLRGWMSKMRSIHQMKQILQNKNISWLNYIQLERWTNEWVKKYNKGRECTKCEQFLLLYEDIQMTDSVKGVVSKIYPLLLDLEEGGSEKEGLKIGWEPDIGKRINEEERRRIWKMRV